MGKGKSKAKSFIEFARYAMRTETMTVAGRVNLVGLVGLFLLVVGAGGLFDLIQVIVRIWKSDYETGLPSLQSFLWVYALLLLGCVAILALARSDRRRD